MADRTFYIATHVNPDWDAIGATWVVTRMLEMYDPVILFVNSASPDPSTLKLADAVVDVGGEYDPARLRFDHHQMRDAAGTSATLLAWRALDGESKAPHFVKIVDLITDADGRNVGAPDVERSYVFGIHALLSAWKARTDHSDRDAEIMRRGLATLDEIESTLRARAEARAQFEEGLYAMHSRVVVLRDAGPLATLEAFERGAEVVLFLDERREETVARGVQRALESRISCARLIDLAQELEPDIVPETSKWFRHPAGFFAGRGTMKAPDPTPLECSFDLLVNAVFRAYNEYPLRYDDVGEKR